MSFQTFFAIAMFAFVSSITPGPNNLMLLTSGVNFGFRPTIPHMLGISFGFGLLVMSVGLGLAQVFQTFPIAYAIMKWVGVAYMVYLAWAIANAGGLNLSKASKKSTLKPMTFFGAAAFQWVNPKAWVMAVGVFSTFLPGQSSLLVVLMVAGIFCAINLPSVSIWALFGARLRDAFESPQFRRLFNYVMAGLLLLSLAPIFLT